MAEAQGVDLFHHLDGWRIPKNHAEAHALLSSFEQGQKGRGQSPALHIQEPGARTNLHEAVFYNLGTLLSPFPTYNEAPVCGKGG